MRELKRWRSMAGWGIGAVALLITAISIVTFFSQRESAPARFSSKQAGVVLSYDGTLRQGILLAEDQQSKTVLRLMQADGKADLLVTVRYEERLRLAASVSGKDVRTVLKESIEATYPQRFSEYKQLSQRDLTIAGRPASEITFTYKSPKGDTIKQRFMLLVRDEDKAVYVAAQAKATDFDELDRQYFNTIFESLRPL